jgi:hypothetical protein
VKLDPEQRARLASEEERALGASEFAARIAVPMSAFEREDFDGLVRWFTKRYPTAGERMRYIRRRMQRMRQRIG